MIFDGDNIDAPQIGKFCGQRSPGIITSTGNFLHLVFMSDTLNKDIGFHARYTTRTNCKSFPFQSMLIKI